MPWFDPASGGTHSRVLLLLEAPGGKTVSSGFISPDNNDGSAALVFELRDEAGLARET
ncbi:uracil-DNA glycosylase family protein [Actinomarinicola tropica]|uniref:Uncharacterized protein n=1 Tax=Actinomarinicola tropica TaxID=2789776 RepID=A0A5Q2RFB0_9ACTN|nr:hypothetical protein [Actinomarinicola tropica]QGG94373.1 hypothetical protein GH723_04225 [Actinomarinicola tropica]